MAARITRFKDAPAYHPAKHYDVAAVRLQGHEAGPTKAFWVGFSDYAPTAYVDEGATAEECVYMVLEGELAVTVEGKEEVLGKFDTLYMPKGVVRSVKNKSGKPVKLLVTIANPQG